MKIFNRVLWSSIFALFFIFGVSGCSRIDAARIQNAIDKTERVIGTVCTAAEVFQAAGVPQPVLDTCAKAMTELGRDEYVLVSQAVDCVSGEKTKQDKSGCIAGLKGWSEVADKLGK